MAKVYHNNITVVMLDRQVKQCAGDKLDSATTDDQAAVWGISIGTEDTMKMSKIDVSKFFSFQRTQCLELDPDGSYAYLYVMKGELLIWDYPVANPKYFILNGMPRNNSGCVVRYLGYEMLTVRPIYVPMWLCPNAALIRT
uniref:Uncharacterized protein n=1 Tax=Oryza barthii TaxID=65489 RepID=A0A0D3GQM9_9ORYZ